MCRAFNLCKASPPRAADNYYHDLFLREKTIFFTSKSEFKSRPLQFFKYSTVEKHGFVSSSLIVDVFYFASVFANAFASDA